VRQERRPLRQHRSVNRRSSATHGDALPGRVRFSPVSKGIVNTARSSNWRRAPKSNDAFGRFDPGTFAAYGTGTDAHRSRVNGEDVAARSTGASNAVYARDIPPSPKSATPGASPLKAGNRAGPRRAARGIRPNASVKWTPADPPTPGAANGEPGLRVAADLTPLPSRRGSGGGSARADDPQRLRHVEDILGWRSGRRQTDVGRHRVPPHRSTKTPSSRQSRQATADAVSQSTSMSA